MPEHMKVLISREKIAEGVERIGHEITRDFAVNRSFWSVCFKGACLFLSDLRARSNWTPRLIHRCTQLWHAKRERRRSAAHQGRNHAPGGQERNPGGRHPRHRINLQFPAQDPAGTEAPDAQSLPLCWISLRAA